MDLITAISVCKSLLEVVRVIGSVVEKAQQAQKFRSFYLLAASTHIRCPSVVNSIQPLRSVLSKL